LKQLRLLRKPGAILDATIAKRIAAHIAEVNEAECKLEELCEKAERGAKREGVSVEQYQSSISWFMEKGNFDAAQQRLTECRAKQAETERPIAKELQSPYLPTGKLGEMVRIDRVRTILDGVTEYTPSRGNCCTRLCSMVRRVTGRKRSVLTQHENELEYLNERLGKLLDEAVTDQNWFDVTATWVMLLSLRSKMTSKCGHAILDAMIQDDALLEGIGRVHQFSEATLDAAGTKEMLMALRKGPALHLKNHAYEYRRTLDAELARIKRLKELQVRAVALSGSAVVAGLIGAANLLARVIYAQHFADSGGE